MRSHVTLLGMISGVACPLQARELQGDQACATPQVGLSASPTRGADGETGGKSSSLLWVSVFPPVKQINKMRGTVFCSFRKNMMI